MVVVVVDVVVGAGQNTEAASLVGLLNWIAEMSMRALISKGTMAVSRSVMVAPTGRAAMAALMRDRVTERAWA